MNHKPPVPKVGTDAYDPPYQSSGEKKIGQLLDQYGLPFFYRQATIIYHHGKNEIWYPSFTLPQYAGAVVDYVQNSDKHGLEERIRIYRYNQVPAVVLGPPDLDKTDWQREIYENLKKEIIPPNYTLDHVLKKMN